jgi:hypothetical protein
MSTNTQWDFWLAQMAGKQPETTPGHPPSGFYRGRALDGAKQVTVNEAIAIWRDEDGKLFFKSSVGRIVTDADRIDEIFSRVCRKPITRELFMQVCEGGQFPDEIEHPAEADRGMGDNLAGLAPHEAVSAEIADLLERFQGWLKTLPNGIEDDTQDAKAANYAKEIASLGKKADETHKREKAPHLEAGRAVDAAWKPVVAAADSAKRAILAPTTEYRRKRAAAEERARQAELARLREEAERAHAEAMAQAEKDEAAAPPPPKPAPVALPPKRPTGLRTVKVVVIDDLAAIAAQLAALPNPPEDFVEICRKAARKMLEAGAPANGARLIEEQRAA